MDATARPQTVAMRRRYPAWRAATFDPTRWAVLFGRNLLGRRLRPARRVVEVGCGTGHNLAALRRAADEVVGIECAPAMAARARRRRLDGVAVRELEYGPEGAGPCDAMVFAYSLSMMPEPAAVLDRVLADLRPGGQLLVLDFLDTPVPAVAWALRRGGVALGPERWSAVQDRFAVDDALDARAFGGLWRWRLLDARRR